MPQFILNEGEIARKIFSEEDSDWKSRTITVDPALYYLVANNGKWGGAGGERGGQVELSSLRGDILATLLGKEVPFVVVWVAREYINNFKLNFSNIFSEDLYKLDIQIALSLRLAIRDWKGSYTQTSLNEGLINFYQYFMADTNSFTHDKLREYLKDSFREILGEHCGAVTARSLYYSNSSQKSIRNNIKEALLLRVKESFKETLELKEINSITFFSQEIEGQIIQDKQLEMEIEKAKKNAKHEETLDALNKQLAGNKAIREAQHALFLQKLKSNPQTPHKSIEPTTPQNGLYMNAQNEFSNQNYPAALNSINQAIDLEKRPEFYRLRANIYDKQGKYAKADDDRARAKQVAMM